MAGIWKGKKKWTWREGDEIEKEESSTMEIIRALQD